MHKRNTLGFVGVVSLGGILVALSVSIAVLSIRIVSRICVVVVVSFSVSVFVVISIGLRTCNGEDGCGNDVFH